MKKRLTRSVILLLASVFAQPLYALEFECSAGSDKRFIRLELPGIEHLCEVTVTYTNDERKVMWYADHDSNFCTEKTNELTNKYENKWGFTCEQWPDHDGVDKLNARQRTILDAELKALIAQGQSTNSPPFLVEGLKAAASPNGANGNNLLVIQFFLHEPNTGSTKDVTHVIHDDGVSWNTLSKIDTLAKYIDENEGYIVNSALISSVTDNGAMKIITVLDEAASTGSQPSAGCYGNQTLATQSDGKIIARTPHRYVCPEADAG